MRAQVRSRGGVVPRRLPTTLILAALVFLLAAAAVVGMAIALSPAEDGTSRPGRLVAVLPGWFGPRAPAGQPPVVQPTVLMNVAPDTARQLNADVPYAKGPIPAARAFIYPGSVENRAAARLCLAGAVLYEAGTAPIDQYAVAQVIVNRVRHPAFAKTVCGVVFQGAERRTGCQFTFACDGALARRPSAAAWAGALASADAVLGGFVFTPVGTATHYHTDWVFPYWQSSLTKLAAVHTHIFYRWAGWWGTASAFTGKITGNERVDPRLLAAIAGLEGQSPVTDETPMEATLPPPISTPAPASVANGVSPSIRIPGVPAGLLENNAARLVNGDASVVVLRLDGKAYPGSFAILANAICAGKPTCLVAGFVDEATIPKAIPDRDAVLLHADFLFRRQSLAEAPEMTWNCTLFPRRLRTQCRAD